VIVPLRVVIASLSPVIAPLRMVIATLDLIPSARHNGKREIQQKRRKRWENKTKNGGCTPGNLRRKRQWTFPRFFGPEKNQNKTGKYEIYFLWS
jgi:hypothetical protein